MYEQDQKLSKPVICCPSKGVMGLSAGSPRSSNNKRIYEASLVTKNAAIIFALHDDSPKVECRVAQSQSKMPETGAVTREKRRPIDR
eukprot:6178089-Pleurochrysis_carterae.AAC.1